MDVSKGHLLCYVFCLVLVVWLVVWPLSPSSFGAVEEKNAAVNQWLFNVGTSPPSSLDSEPPIISYRKKVHLFSWKCCAQTVQRGSLPASTLYQLAPDQLALDFISGALLWLCGGILRGEKRVL